MPDEPSACSLTPSTWWSWTTLRSKPSWQPAMYSRQTRAIPWPTSATASSQCASRLAHQAASVFEENLREHYSKTLAAWCANLDAHWDEAVAEVGQGIARVWRLYMAGSQLGFDRNVVQLHQVLGVKLHADGSSGMPLRPDWEPAQARAKASA